MGWGGKGEWVGWKIVVDCGGCKRMRDFEVNFSVGSPPATHSVLCIASTLARKPVWLVCLQSCLRWWCGSIPSAMHFILWLR